MISVARGVRVWGRDYTPRACVGETQNEKDCASAFSPFQRAYEFSATALIAPKTFSVCALVGFSLARLPRAEIDFIMRLVLAVASRMSFASLVSLVGIADFRFPDI